MYYAPTTAAPTYPLKIGTIVGEGNGTPLQYSCLENPMDGGAWQAAVHGVTKSRTQLKQLSTAHNRNYIIIKLFNSKNSCY